MELPNLFLLIFDSVLAQLKVYRLGYSSSKINNFCLISFLLVVIDPFLFVWRYQLCFFLCRVAERKKAEGNEFYKKKSYREAIKLYTEAIGE